MPQGEEKLATKAIVWRGAVVALCLAKIKLRVVPRLRMIRPHIACILILVPWISKTWTPHTPTSPPHAQRLLFEVEPAGPDCTSLSCLPASLWQCIHTALIRHAKLMRARQRQTCNLGPLARMRSGKLPGTETADLLWKTALYLEVLRGLSERPLPHLAAPS